MLKKALTAAALGALLLSGCDTEPDEAGPTDRPAPNQRILQGGAPGQPNTTLTALPEPRDRVTEADVEFIRMMIPHHAQALELTSLVPDRTSREDVPLFAERIQVSQEEEIQIMQNWLRDRGEPIHDLSDDGHHGGELMPGMLTPEQMSELEAADGEEFDKLFLQRMYVHHHGAVQMVEELNDADGGQDPFVFDLAKEIDGDQRIEMDRIVGMLADMGEQPPAVD